MALARFNGAGGRIVVPAYKGVTISGTPRPHNDARSITFWMQTTQSGAPGTICYWGNDLTGEVTDGGQNRIRMIQGRVQLFGRGSFVESNSLVNDGDLHHILFTYTSTATILGHEDFSSGNVHVDGSIDNGRRRGGSNLKIQPDGSERTDIAVRTPAEHVVVIGARPVGSGDITSSGSFTDYFDGDIDEFAIYDEVLSTGTFSGIYNGGTPGADLLALGQVPDLQVWYTMGDDGGDSAPGTMVDQRKLTFDGRDGTVSAGVSIVPSLVGYSKASTPPTETAPPAGSTVIIYGEAAIQEGDLLLAIASFNGAGTITTPAGWTTVMSRDVALMGGIHWVIQSRVATSSEPAYHMWTFDVDGVPRSGCMVSFRGANATLGDSAFAILTGTVPTLTNNVSGSILIAFANAQTSNPNTEEATANSPLDLETQHVSGVQVTALAAEEDLPIGTISGRSFSHPNVVVPDIAGIIIEGRA